MSGIMEDRELIALLRREGQYSGVWFGPRLLDAANRLETLTTPSQGLDAATVRHCAEMVRDRAVTISASSLNGTPASDASKIAARHLIRAAEDMERALATDPHQHGAGNGEKHDG